MIKCIKVDGLPDDLQITYIAYHTLAELKMKIELEFEDTCDELKDGPTYIVAKVPDDYSGNIDLDSLLLVGTNIVSYCYIPNININTELWDINKSRRETVIGRKGENLLRKRGSKFKLTASASVMFKRLEIPRGFKGELHKFEDKAGMCQEMYSNFGIKRVLDDIESGVYYICAVLCEDFEGPITYDYFISCLRHNKLIAYKFED